MDDLQSLDLEKNPEMLLDHLSAVKKLRERYAKGKQPKMCGFDIDGSIYDQQFVGGQWVKSGDNSESTKILTEESIPHGLISARPDHVGNGEEEMACYKLSPADYVISGAGTLVYWRTDQGKFVLVRR